MEVLRPGDVGYDGARTTWNACIDRRPSAIIRPQSTDDVRRALASSDDPVTVRGGGHHVTGACARDGAAMLDLRRLSRVRIADGCAIVEGGTLWSSVTIAAEQHNLVGAAGTVGSVGVVGLTLGGGLGWLTRRYGLACDSVNAVELVTADGSLLHVTADFDPELWWGLRGAGTNFGVVTQLELRLHAVRQVYAGTAAFPLDRLADVLDALRDLDQADEELTTMLLVIPGAELGLAQRHVATLNACWCGDLKTGRVVCRTLVDPLGEPLLDTFRELPFSELVGAFADSRLARRGYRNDWEAFTLPDLSAAPTIVDLCREIPSELSYLQLMPLGGAVGRSDSAVGYRASRFLGQISAVWESTRDDEVCRRWTREFHSALEPTRPACPNHVSREDEARVSAVYGEAGYARLVGLKRRLDPDRRFLPALAVGR
jgi:FAD/FMN-containing dehydrogenase